MCRTKNKHERAVIDDLEAEGYTVVKRGWPDFLAAKGDCVRFIEVKPLHDNSGRISKSGLKPDQITVAEILSRIGIEVELVRGL